MLFSSAAAFTERELQMRQALSEPICEKPTISAGAGVSALFLSEGRQEHKRREPQRQVVRITGRTVLYRGTKHFFIPRVPTRHYTTGNSKSTPQIEPNENKKTYRPVKSLRISS
jgi:hypothetical protein